MVVTKKIRPIDLVAISFLIFSIYFGAGNLIFPVKIGFRVGENLTPTLIGFILASAALPALVLWACLRVNGGLDKITEALPKPLALLTGITIYTIMGPFVGLPRFAGVSYKTIQPLLGGVGESSSGLLIFSLIFFGITLKYALTPGKILDVVGKVMAPLLVGVVLLIAFGAVFAPQGQMAATDPKLSTSAMKLFAFGFQEGYQTLNAMGSLVMSLVILNTVRQLGLRESEITSFTMKGMLLTCIGLAITFTALAYLGATAHSLVDLPQHAVTGAEVTPVYAQALFGKMGVVALAIVITLACLTTAIALISSCGTYFSRIFPAISYRNWAIIFTIASLFGANIGLGPLLALARPVLLSIYPVAMTLALLCLVQHRMSDRRFVFLTTLAPVVILSIFTGLKMGGVHSLTPLYEAFAWLPMAKLGFGWVIPALVFYGIGMMLSKKKVESAQVA